MMQCSIPVDYNYSATDTLVSDSHAEATAIVAVVIIVNGKNQTPIHRHSRRQAGSYQERLAHLSIRIADVGDERAHARRW